MDISFCLVGRKKGTNVNNFVTSQTILLISLAVSILGAPPFIGDYHQPPRTNAKELEDDNEIPNIVHFGLSREHPDQPVVIYRQIQDQDVQGSYAWEYELENSIRANEEGHLKNAGTPNETQVAQVRQKSTLGHNLIVYQYFFFT